MMIMMLIRFNKLIEYMHFKVTHFFIDALFPECPYGSVKITIYFDMINLIGNFMMVGELKNPDEE
jgi:hypothetical protein